MTTQRVSLQPAYVLHHRPFRDTSRIVDLFTRDYGRTAVVARAVRAPTSRLKGLLQPFSALMVSFSTKGELGTLSGAEATAAGHFALGGDALLSAFYVNELLLRLMEKGDPHPEVYGEYERTLNRLANEPSPHEPLRVFEKRLLEALGYGLNLGHDIVTGEPLVAEKHYEFVLEEGPTATHASATGALVFPGRSLMALAEERLGDERCMRHARILLRSALDLYLGSRPLRTREVMLSLRPPIEGSGTREGK
jgi:DNA repair protein RecO (recombination protein O)